MSTIYLIRHGETEWNLEERFQGTSNTMLTDNGIEQGRKLAKRLKDEEIANIYTSPLERAKVTAQFIGEESDKEVIITNDFKEISFGDWEGLTTKEIGERYSWANDWFINPESHRIPNSDDMEIEKVRLRSKLIELAEGNSSDKSNLIVSHAGVIRLAILGAMDLPLSYYWRLTFSNTCINILEYHEKRFLIRCLNDTSHLLKT